MTQVVVLDRNVGYGDNLAGNDPKFARLPTEFLPACIFFTAGELFPKGQDVSRPALGAMTLNEPVLASTVTAPGVGAGVSARLAEGRRAFAVSDGVASGVWGFPRPNGRVDIFWTGILPGHDRRTTKLIDTAVRIVAVDQSADAERTRAVVARIVTVEATPHLVAALAQAQSHGVFPWRSSAHSAQPYPRPWKSISATCSGSRRIARRLALSPRRRKPAPC